MIVMDGGTDTGNDNRDRCFPNLFTVTQYKITADFALDNVTEFEVMQHN